MAEFNLTQDSTDDTGHHGAASDSGRWLVLTGLISPLGLIVATWLWLKGKRGVAVITLLLSVLSMAGYAYVYQSSHHKAKPATINSTAYSFSLSLTGSVAGAGSGNGASFLLPGQFRAGDNNSTVNSEYKRQTSSSGHTVTNGEVRALAIPMPAADLAATLSIAKSTFTPGQDQTNVTLQLVRFIQGSLSNDYKPILAKAVPLQTANIKDNAWQFDFTASGPDKSYLPPMKGKVIYAFGKNTIYYFVVAATQDGWSANASSWNQIVDSLKIDQ